MGRFLLASIVTLFIFALGFGVFALIQRDWLNALVFFACAAAQVFNFLAVRTSEQVLRGLR